MSLELADTVEDEIRRHARRRYPEECCGVLVGSVTPLAPGQEERAVVQARPADNEREDERERRYLIGPETLRTLEEEATQDGLDIIGFYHSHPDHPAEPSETDRAQAWPWYSYVIVSVREGRPEELRSWRLEADRSRFREEPVAKASDTTKGR